MKQVSKICLMQLNNGEHHQFHLSMYNLFFDCVPFSSLPSRQEMIIAYRHDYEVQEIAMNRERGSARTKELIEANRLRNQYDSCFRLKVKAAMLEFNEDVREAATRIKFVLDKYGNVKQLPYSEKSAVMAVRYNELVTNYVGDLNKIDALNMIQNLDNANLSFNLAFNTRSMDKIKAEKQNVLDTRTLLDAGYRVLELQINSLSVIDPHGDYDRLIDSINYQIAYFKQQVANRMARLAAEKKDIPPVPKGV